MPSNAREFAPRELAFNQRSWNDGFRYMSAIMMRDVLAMSVAERIQLAEDIWDSIAAAGEPVPVSDAQREELDRRVEDHRLHPDSGTEWDDLKRRLGKRKGSGGPFSSRQPKRSCWMPTPGMSSVKPVWAASFCDVWMPAWHRCGGIPSPIRWCISRFAWR
jgi:putative addiction module component (TIGR02574 family)